jgi:V/A-type H+-transporting ATPase subunit I
MLESCKQQDINLFCDSLSRDKANVYLAIIYIKKQFERLETILKNYHFNFVVLGRHKGTAEDRLLEINREILVLDGQIQDVKLKIIELSGQQFKLMVVYDYLANINNRQKAEKSLIKQEFTFCLRGWIKHRDIELFQRGIANNFKNIALFVSDPKEDEDIPVILENKQLIQPFEFITQIYGMPKYSELDPTPFLAPFFFLYFGFCVSDVGYGIMLTLISWLALKKFKMGAQGIKFFRLFSYCGISTIVIGALTGSWFGNLFDLLAENSAVFLPLKRLKDSLIVLDPLKEPTKLLGVALCFGIIQVWSGNIVAAIGNIKNRRYMNVILDQGSMIIFLFGLTGLGLIFLNLLDKPWTGLFKYSVLVGTVALILTQGRFEKGVGSKLFYGIYNLYNAFSGYLSDILSYSRLWALGLVTGVMAATINLIALQFGQIISSMMPFVGKAIFLKIIVTAFAIAVIFVLGHAVSFLMNLLGAFVHPLRLQFVEFFSKFFKSGGSTFRPFKGEAKYINIVYK